MLYGIWQWQGGQKASTGCWYTWDGRTGSAPAHFLNPRSARRVAAGVRRKYPDMRFCTKTLPPGRTDKNVIGKAFEEAGKEMREERVNHPRHYTSHPSGVECITVVETMTFCVGSAIRYLWRAGLKVTDQADTRSAALEDLKKARWYIDREIQRVETAK